MENVDMQVEGDTLTIKVDLSKRGGKSPTGKTIRVASTEGNVALEGHPEIKIGLNVFTPSK